MDASEILEGSDLVPVVTIQNKADGVPIARALSDAGINIIEVTLRTPAALPAIAAITTELPNMVVGAGSIRFPEQFTQISEAGAAFAVSPGHTEKLLQAANMPYIPGAATSSECLRLLEQGFELQKFFPAERLGGTPLIKAISDPIPEVRFCPTGGITRALVQSYLETPSVYCVGCSWLVDSADVAAGRFAQISEVAAAALGEARSYRQN